MQHLLDEAKAAIVKSQGKDDGRILHLHYGGQVLAPPIGILVTLVSLTARCSR